jgi:hypothetical protein
MTRIQRDFSFQAGVYYDSHFLMNIYEITACIDVDTDSLWEQNIAMERISCFFDEYLDNCIFVKNTEKKIIDQYTNCGLKVCTLPEEPYEQMISVMLLLKLNAITEGRFTITDISVCSKLSDGITYLYDIDEPTGPFATQGWWANSNASISDVKPSKKEKIVQLFSTHASDWSEIGLSWKEKVPKLVVDKPEITFTIDSK